MNRLDICNFSGAYYARDIQITFPRFRRPDANRLIGEAQIWGIFVRLGIDRYGFYSEFMACTNYTQRYLAAVSYLYF